MSVIRCLTVVVLGVCVTGCIGGRLQGPVARLKHTRSTHFAWVSHRGNYVPPVAGPFEKDFERGWKVGYRQMATTGSGDVPAVPDRRYWSPDFQSPWGQQRISAWQQGFEEGVGAAFGEQPGPVMLASANEPMLCPECESAGEPTLESAAPNGGSPSLASPSEDITPQPERAKVQSRLENGHPPSAGPRGPSSGPPTDHHGGPFDDEADDVPLPFEPEVDTPMATDDRQESAPEPLEGEPSSPMDTEFESIPDAQPDQPEETEFDTGDNLQESLEDLFNPTSRRVDRLPLTQRQRGGRNTNNADGWNVARHGYPAARNGKVRAEGADPTPVGIQSGNGVIRLVHRPMSDAPTANSATLDIVNPPLADGSATHTAWQNDIAEIALEAATSLSKSTGEKVDSDSTAARNEFPSQNADGPEFPQLTFDNEGDQPFAANVTTRPVARAAESTAKPPVILIEELSSADSEPIQLERNRIVSPSPTVTDADTSELLRRLKSLSGDGANEPIAERNAPTAGGAPAVPRDDLFQSLQGAVDGP